MKSIIYISIFFFTPLVQAQISYEPVFISLCTNKPVDAPVWWISDSAGGYTSDNMFLETVTLPQSGHYRLHLLTLEETISIFVPDEKRVTDTIYLPELEFNQYIGYSEYTFCDSLANGELESYFQNGRVKLKGTFMDGQPSDTLFEYYSDGQLKELFVPDKKGWNMTRYFNNGQIESVYDVKKRFEKEYYPNGQLRIERNWTKKYRTSTTSYYPDGTVRESSDDKKLEAYNAQGILLKQMKRKEVLRLYRLFAKTPYERHDRFFDYEWLSYDSLGVITRKIKFSSGDFISGDFPGDVTQISDFLFDEIIFYRNGEAFKKIESKYIKEGSSFVQKLVVSRKEEDNWVEERTESVHMVYELIKEMEE